LQDLLGTPSRRAATKDRRVLHQMDRQWLAASPFCMIATSGADGTCDVSPKGDPPGFVHVLNDSTIVIPDRPGNNRADGFRNILGNPHVGLVFLVPGRGETLRINGRCRLIREAPFFDDLVVRGHRPVLALLVEIEQVFYHCPKAFMRSKLWQPGTWTPNDLPSTACITKSVQHTEETLDELEEYYGPSYQQRLYR
jgi:PPOX class probable FMN-dependent enzyme